MWEARRSSSWNVQLLLAVKQAEVAAGGGGGGPEVSTARFASLFAEA